MTYLARGDVRQCLEIGLLYGAHMLCSWKTPNNSRTVKLHLECRKNSSRSCAANSPPAAPSYLWHPTRRLARLDRTRIRSSSARRRRCRRCSTSPRRRDSRRASSRRRIRGRSGARSGAQDGLCIVDDSYVAPETRRVSAGQDVRVSHVLPFKFGLGQRRPVEGD